MTKANLEAMGLVEQPDGTFAPKKNETVLLAGVKCENNKDTITKIRVEPSKDHTIQDVEYEEVPSSTKKERVYMGIDPGKNGAIAMRAPDGKLYHWKMPLDGTDVDAKKLLEIITEANNLFDLVIVLEDVHSVFGTSAKSNFQFGFACGVIRAVVVVSGVPFHPIQPKSWQKIIWSNDDKIYKPKKPEQKNPSIDTKATSLKAAKRMFPGESFLATERSSVPHDGIVDAALIAESGRRTNL